MNNGGIVDMLTCKLQTLGKGPQTWKIDNSLRKACAELRPVRRAENEEIHSLSPAVIPSSGFTLIEMLVVIGIVILLVAMLVPVLLKSRESAFQYYCMNNLIVLGKSYHAYAQDFNDGIVPLIRASAKYSSREWYTVLEPYGKDILGWEDYGDKDKLGASTNWVRCPKYKPTYNAYAQNAYIGFKDFLGSKRYYPVKFSQIHEQTKIILMGEHGHLLAAGAWYNALGKDWGQAGHAFAPTPHFGEKNINSRWINGCANFLFCDGHTESVNWKNNWLRSDNIFVDP
jgi:prepilin-type processing-associated H-X9-DG protein